MQCSCGQVMNVDAASREEAAEKMKAVMTQQALEEHFKMYHNPSEALPSLDQAHTMIDKSLLEGEPTIAQM